MNMGSAICKTNTNDTNTINTSITAIQSLSLDNIQLQLPEDLNCTEIQFNQYLLALYSIFDFNNPIVFNSIDLPIILHLSHYFHSDWVSNICSKQLILELNNIINNYNTSRDRYSTNNISSITIDNDSQKLFNYLLLADQYHQSELLNKCCDIIKSDWVHYSKSSGKACELTLPKLSKLVRDKVLFSVINKAYPGGYSV